MSFLKTFFASLLAIIVSGVILVVIVFGIIAGVSKSITSLGDSKVENTSILVVELNKTLHEQGQSNSLAALGNGPAYTGGLYDMTEAINHAKTDSKIKGMLIKLEPSPNGWATLQQLRMAITDFKQSGKFIYAYGENITQGAYFVGSAADHIFLNPTGGIEIKGFATVIPFFKGTLEKLEVEPEIFYAGKFKSATEPFRADKISDPNRVQITAYQHDMWNQFLLAAAQHTRKDTATINGWATTGAIEFPADAKKNGAVDDLLYWDQVEQQMKTKAGINDTAAIKYINLDDYANAVKGDKKISDQRIAIIYAEGQINDGDQDDQFSIGSKNMVATIRKVRDNKKIKAVVLRVNSPGGSALASEVILRELQLLRAKKPVIVSMGDYAASGGYYITCHADSIFAMPNTITGSIGVFSMAFNAEKLMKNKLGVTFDEVKTAPYADFPNLSRSMTPAEAARMQRSVDTIYNIFKKHVAESRKMSLADVDSLAQGRVWTGTQALKINLIDGIGNLNRAIKSAAWSAKLTDYKVVTYPEPSDKFEMMLHKLKGSADASILTEAIKSELGTDYDWYRKIKQLRNMNGKAMMAMPFMPTIE